MLIPSTDGAPRLSSRARPPLGQQRQQVENADGRQREEAEGWGFPR